MEPPHPVLPGRPAHELTGGPVPAIRLAAGAGAGILLLTSSGHPLVVAVLLGMVAANATAGLTSALAGIAAALRWGTGSLSASAGAQAVLGPAADVGPALAAGGSVAGAVGVVLVSPGGWAAIPFGLAAGLLVAGPSAITAGDAAIRFGAAGACIALAWASGRLLPRRIALPLGLVAGLASVALQVLS